MLEINNMEKLNNLDIKSIRNVKELCLSGINIIPEGKFRNLDKLEKLIINGTTKIELGSFMNCPNLKILEISEHIKAIDDFAFADCNENIIIKSNNEFKDVNFGVYNDVIKDYYKLPEIGVSLNDLSWNKINLISEKKLASEYFDVGEEKEFQINNKNYHIQILGFDHDRRSDGRGKLGITFSFKEAVDIKKINSNKTNIGGWSKSEIRKVIYNYIYKKMPFELKSNIKYVEKKSDLGNENSTSLITTKDKIFLLSAEEVGLNPEYSYLKGQGAKYEFFIDNNSRVKRFLNNSTINWWLRSTDNEFLSSFYYVTDEGGLGSDDGCELLGIVPAFCI